MEEGAVAEDSGTEADVSGAEADDSGAAAEVSGEDARDDEGRFAGAVALEAIIGTPPVGPAPPVAVGPMENGSAAAEEFDDDGYG